MTTQLQQDLVQSECESSEKFGNEELKSGTNSMTYKQLMFKGGLSPGRDSLMNSKFQSGAMFETQTRPLQIEDFDSPLATTDRNLQQLLIQLRNNLNEPDHPINIIVKKFQDIITWHVNEKKQQFYKTKGFNPVDGKAEFEIVDITDLCSNDSEDISKITNNNGGVNITQKLKKTPARTTYNRQTLESLPHELRFAEVIISEVKKLVCILYGSLIRFYIPVMRFEDLHEMKEDLIELLTSLTVRGELSKTLLLLCRYITRPEEIMLMRKLQELQKIRPEDIGIDKLYTLNETSELFNLYAQQKREQQEQEFNSPSPSGDVGGSLLDMADKTKSIRTSTSDQKNFNEHNQFVNTLIQAKDDIITRSKSVKLEAKDTVKTLRKTTPKLNDEEKQKEQDIPFIITKALLKQRLAVKPYILAIENLRRLRDFDTPIDKMRCITQTSKYIVQSVDYFWKDIPLIQKKKLTLDADQLLMIFIYATIRSKITELMAHLKLINEFSTDTLRHTKLGYYTSTLEVAIQQILVLSQEGIESKSFMRNVASASMLIEQNLKASLITDFPLEFMEDYDGEGGAQLEFDNQNFFNK